jgi:hypothetical protein
MKPQWHFNQRRACDRMRDSANDAFFTAESLENLSEALVREGIQNSLDAAQRSNGQPRGNSGLPKHSSTMLRKKCRLRQRGVVRQ